jgi:4-amino-4-deoxy-L-arabinose transferase-like glycosyltransferase
VPFALSAFLTCIAFAAYLKRPSLPRLLLTALALGLAMVTKLAAFFLLPVFVLLYAVWLWQGHKSLTLRQGVLSLAAIVLLSGVVVFLTYEIPALQHGVKTGGIDPSVVHALLDRSKAGATFRLTTGAPPGHPFLKGLVVLLDLNVAGHPAYLFGKVRTQGWWYYFPVAFAVKTPVGTLAFLALAAWICLARLRRGAMRRAAFDWFVLAIPIAVYSAFSLVTPINVGVRHLLPIFPFLFVLSAAAFIRARWRRASILLLVLGIGLAAESIFIYPHYLAF